MKETLFLVFLMSLFSTGHSQECYCGRMGYSLEKLYELERKE